MTSQIQSTSNYNDTQVGLEDPTVLLNHCIASQGVTGCARQKYGAEFDKITYQPSGIRARSLDVSPIEAQTISVHLKDGTWHTIGDIILEAHHLGPLKTRQGVEAELIALIENDPYESK